MEICTEPGKYRDSSLLVEERVNDLLSRMTLKEKVRQMDMYNGAMFINNMDPAIRKATKKSQVLTDKLEELIGEEGIGCIHDLYPYDSNLTNEIQQYCLEKTRLGIPVLVSEEALHGLCSPDNTIFPQMITMAAAFNRELTEKVGRGIAAEMRSKGIHLTFSPVLEIAREPRWGRTEETFGEDTYLAGEMGLFITKGLQGESLSSDSSVVSEPKHFAVHSISRGGLNCAPVSIGEREIRRDYLPVFEKAVVEGGAMSVMCAYHSIDGIPCAANEWLLKRVLRDEWDFKGFVCSDLGAIKRTHTIHKIAASPEDAIRQCVAAGMDMQFYDFDHDFFQEELIKSVENGEIDLAEIDRAVGSILRVKFMLGLFDHPYIDENLSARRSRCKAHLDTALEAARESICLLKNEGNILPISTDKVRKIALIGPNADYTQLGDYLAPTKGNEIKSVYQELKALLPKEIEILYEKGVSVTEGDLKMVDPRSLFYPDDDKNGLKGEYFNSMNMEGEPDLVRLDANVDFNFIMNVPGEGINGDEFAARWTGRIILPRDKVCLVGLTCSDEAMLWIDDVLIGEYSRNSKKGEPYKECYFKAGQEYSIKIEYLKKKGGGEVLQFGWSDGYENIKGAVETASQSDIAIVVCGESNSVSGEGKDRSNLGLPGKQSELIKAVHATGTPTIMVLMNGRPLTLNWEKENIPAIVEAWLPGEFGGRAIAEILLGICNPSGKLPISFPKTTGQLPVFYNKLNGSERNYVDGDSNPAFSFGHGLSYTRFEYSNLEINAQAYALTGKVRVKVYVKNSGEKAGKEVVQLYVNDVYSSTVKPVKELKGFKKVYLTPGETKEIEFKLGFKELAVLDRNMQWKMEPGKFKVFIGGNLLECIEGEFEI